jgi:hypothetical protein
MGRTRTPPAELAQAVREALSSHVVDGHVREVVESEALLAFRPKSGL